MDFHKIIYETTRALNVQDKISIASLFIFAQNIDDKIFADLLYSENYEKNITELNENYNFYFKINLKNAAVREAIQKTAIKLQKNFDEDKYYLALHNNDPFALAIADIVSIYKKL